MLLSADQCRAARSLLNWTQDQLATNANVSRATVVDFETNTRNPIQNNLKSMSDCMFMAGVEFLQEEGDKGVGVRFRTQKLEYTTNVRMDRFNRRATMRMRFSGENFLCHIDLDAVDEYKHSSLSTDAEFTEAISEMLHILLAAIERYVGSHIKNGEMNLTYEMIT